jgi:hypothetical protein
MVSFQTKNPILLIHILADLEMENAVIYSGHLEYFTTIGYFIVIWYIFPALVYCTKKNLSTLVAKKQFNVEDRFFVFRTFLHFRAKHISMSVY